MITKSLEAEYASINLSFDELYCILQCLWYVDDNMPEGDMGAILLLNKKQLEHLSGELKAVKNQMQDLGGGS